jgi:hypothetical protein
MKQYLQPRSFYDAAMITDTGDRVIYCESTLLQILTDDYAHTVRGDYRFTSEVRINHEARKQAMRWLRYVRGSMVYADSPFIAARCATCLGPIIQTLQQCPALDYLQPCAPSV